MMLVVLVLVLVVMVMALAVGIVALVLIMVVMVMMLVVLMLILVVMMVALAVGIVTLVLVMMVVVMRRFLLETLEFLLDRVAALHCCKKLLAVELRPRRCNDGRGRVVRAQKRDRLIKLCLRNTVGVRKHDTARVLDLIVEKFTEILHVHLALLYVNDRGEAIEHIRIGRNALHRANDVGKLANTRGLDQNTVGRIGIQNLLERLAKVADQGAADATAVHFGDLNARILHKSAVNADLTEFVLNEYQLFPGVCLGQKLFDERGLARSQKSGKNINLCHVIYLLFSKSTYIITRNITKVNDYTKLFQKSRAKTDGEELLARSPSLRSFILY